MGGMDSLLCNPSDVMYSWVSNTWLHILPPYSFIVRTPGCVQNYSETHETVLLDCTTGKAGSCFRCYTTTVPHMNLNLMLDILKVNFWQIPPMFTTVLHKKRSCWYWSPKFRLPSQIPAISPTEIVHGWWNQNDQCHHDLFYHSI